MTAHPTLARAGLAAVLGVVLLSGCGGGNDTAATSAAAPEAAGLPAAGAVAPESGAGQPAALSVALPRAVIRTAGLSVEVADVRAAADKAVAVAVRAGGGLEAEDAEAGRDQLRLRVAPDELTDVLGQLAGLGRETSRTVGSDDVTEQVADLDSRASTQRASVERVRAPLGRATALSDVVALEAQLADRESELESLQARRRAVSEKADLATVTLTLTAVDAPVVAAAEPRPGFRDGLDSGVTAFLGATRVLAVVGGALLPFVPLALIALLVVRRLARTRLPRSPREPVPVG